MFKSYLKLNFIVSNVLGLSVYVAQYYKIKLPVFINNHLNDFLIIPIVLSLCLFVLRFTRGDKRYNLPVHIILFLCVGYSFFFENIMPQIHTRYTADFLDVLAYFLGGIWFWFLQKRNNKKPLN